MDKERDELVEIFKIKMDKAIEKYKIEMRKIIEIEKKKMEKELSRELAIREKELEIIKAKNSILESIIEKSSKEKEMYTSSKNLKN